MISEFLCQLGVTPNYHGFHYAEHAVALAVEDPKRLLFITKTLYPAVAAHYGTTWGCVERNIRTVISLVWDRERETLNAFAGHQLKHKPTAAQFISILMLYLQKTADN